MFSASTNIFPCALYSRLYQGVDWCNRIPHSPAPPKTSKELNADIVSYRYEAKRYEPINQNWQVTPKSCTGASHKIRISQ